MGYRVIRTTQWNYIRYRDPDQMVEFYDLLHDPYELQNAIQRPEFSKTRQQFHWELDSFLSQEPEHEW